jgi:two-component system, NarL family, response regulator DevR
MARATPLKQRRRTPRLAGGMDVPHVADYDGLVTVAIAGQGGRPRATQRDDMTTRVLVVESQKLVRQGIRAELSRKSALDVVETASGAEAIAAVAHDPPDVVLLDFELPDRSGPEICAALLERHPTATVIVLSGRRDEASARAALDAGARGYLLADEDLDLSLAIERSLAGERVIDPRVAALLLDGDGGGKPKLSAQELRVLSLVAEGLTNPEIGTRLFLSRHTVKEYVSHAMRKLDATNRIEAVRRATALGLIEGTAPNPAGESPQAKETLVYNDSDAPAHGSELRVTPLKIDKLDPRSEAP